MFSCLWIETEEDTHLYVSAVVPSGWQLDSSERDRTFKRHFDCRLLHAVLAVQTRGPGDGAAAEVSLYLNQKEVKSLP